MSLLAPRSTTGLDRVRSILVFVSLMRELEKMIDDVEKGALTFIMETEPTAIAYTQCQQNS